MNAVVLATANFLCFTEDLMKIKHLFYSCFITSAAALTCSAATLYDSTQDYTGGSNVNFSRTTSNISKADLNAWTSGDAPITRSIAFDVANPMSPGSGYTGPTFYGGWEFGLTDIATTSFTKNVSSVNRVEGSVGANTALLQGFKPANSGGIGSVTGYSRGAYVFALGGAIALDSASFEVIMGGFDNTGDGYFLVRDSATQNWYASNLSSQGALTLDLDGTTQWSAFNTADMTIGATVGAEPFGTVDYLGVFGASSGTATTTNGLEVLGAFQLANLSYTAVPEPSAFAALLAAVALGVVLMRRRARSKA